MLSEYRFRFFCDIVISAQYRNLFLYTQETGRFLLKEIATCL